MEEIDLGNAIQHCLNELPEEFRAIVVLVEMEEMDYSEASQVTGAPLEPLKAAWRARGENERLFTAILGTFTGKIPSRDRGKL